MKDYINTPQLIFTAISGYIGYFLGGFDGLIYALVAFVVIDYIIGLMAAAIEKRLSSDICFRGFSKRYSFSLLWASGTLLISI
jgi:phage-related holin